MGGMILGVMSGRGRRGVNLMGDMRMPPLSHAILKIVKEVDEGPDER